jgi:hypothetical protein
MKNRKEKAAMLKHSLIAVLTLSAPLVSVAQSPSRPRRFNRQRRPKPPRRLTGPAPTAPVAPAQPVYRAGSVVTVYQLQEQSRGAYQQGQPIGSFVNELNPWSLSQHKQQADLSFFIDKPLGYEADAYFVAKSAGSYSFAAQVDLPPSIIFADPEHLKKSNRGWINCRYRLIVAAETVIDMGGEHERRSTRKEDEICGLTQHGFGTLQLQEGLHRVRQCFSCAGERRLRDPITQSAYPAGCPLAGKRFAVDTFPGDDGRVTLRVRHPDDNAPVMLKTNELVHEKR